MEFRKVLALRGPNIWGHSPVLEAWVDLGPSAGWDAARSAVLAERLSAALDECEGPSSAASTAAELRERLGRGAGVLETLAQIAVGLQLVAGAEVSAEQVRAHVAGETARVVIPFEDEALARSCLDAARRLCLAAAEGSLADAREEVDRIVGLARQLLPGPTLRAVIAAARARDIPAWRLELGGLILLGHGARQRRVVGGGTDRTGIVGQEIVGDPELVRSLLREAGIPVPIVLPADDAEDACGIARSLGTPVVVRPRDDPGAGAALRGAVAHAEVAAAYAAARERADDVVVERLVAGDRFRLLVVGDRLVAAARIEPGSAGVVADVTERVHPEVAARAVEAAGVVGLDVAAVEVVAEDIGLPLEGQPGAVTAVGLGLEPGAGPVGPPGTARALGEAIVASLLPEGQDGRIPIVGVTGVNGKTTTTRLIAHLVRGAGRRVGMTCTDGIYVGDRKIEGGDCSGPGSARWILLNPAVDAAVLETARGGILRAGLGFDRCDVAVVTNIGEGDHLGMGGVETVEELARVKRVLVEAVGPGGAAVLNADDPLVAAMAEHAGGRVIYFAREPEATIADHRRRGGQAAFVREGAIVLAEGDDEQPLVSLADVPLTFGGRIGFQVENALAAAAAAWALGLDPTTIRAGLASFVGDARQAPGRFNVFELAGRTAVVDYGHNTSAVAALVDAIGQLPHRSRTITYTAAGDRRDRDIIEQGTMLGDAFDRVVLYEDSSTRGRPRGEIIRLFRVGLASGTRVAEVLDAYSEAEAVSLALRASAPDDLIVFQADVSVERTLEYVRRHADGAGAPVVGG